MKETEEKKNLKLKLGTLIILIAIVIVVIGAIIINKKQASEPINNETTNQMVSQNNNQIANQTTVNNEQDPSNIATGEIKKENFDVNFLKLENEKKNMVYSPLSIKYALNMLKEGANGTTKAQIEKVIGDLSLTKYTNQDKVLSLANTVYIRNSYASYIKDEFKNNLIQKYQAEVNYDDFKDAKKVNNWIENKTLGIIKNMLDDGMVQDPNNQMLLINALAIDMEWKEKFSEEKTGGETFYLENGSNMLATMLHKKVVSESASYYKGQDLTALSMDLQKYGDTELEFIAIMPNENLASYIEKINIEDIKQIESKLVTASVAKGGINISIPKFSFAYDLKLKNDLIKLGIQDAFEEVADFSNMSSRALFVSEALHKANIDFTEKGIKAAAVTVFAMKDNAAIIEPEQPEEIKIDKPFFYIIKDKNTGEIWFVGAVYEPNSWEKDKADYQAKF